MSLDTQLAQIENAQLVRRLPDAELAYLFKHALTQETAYESLLLKTRREIHHQVAEAYENLYSDRLDEFASLLAHHFAQAGNDEKLVEYAIRAGDRAHRLSAIPEAEAHYADALEALSRLPDNDENRRRRIDTIIKRAAVSFASANPERNLASLREAEPLVESLLRANATSPIDRLRRAQVQYWIGRMHFYRMRRREALATVRQVLPIAQELQDEELGALASGLMGRNFVWQGELVQAQSMLEQSLAPFEQRGNWTEWTVSVALLSIALAARGDYRAGVAQAEHALARAQELNHQSGASILYPLMALVHLMGGDFEKMLEASRADVQSGLALGNMLPTYSAFATQAWAESRLGEHDAARRSLARAEAISQANGGHYLIDDWLAAIKAEMALNAGQIAEALSLAQAAVNFARRVDGNFAEALARRTWAEALVALHPPQWDEAEQHLAKSLRLFEEGNAVLEAARTHVAWGKVLLERGDVESARGHFEQATAQFQASGLARELNETRRALAELGALVRE